MSSSNAAPLLGVLPTASSATLLPFTTEQEMWSPTVDPWLVLAISDSENGPATVDGALHEAPPLALEMQPASSWQVDAVQFEFGVDVVVQIRFRGAARGGVVDAETRYEVVDRAGGRVDRHAGHRRPGGAIAGCRVDDVVGRPAGTESAVLPRHLHRARAVDLGGRQALAIAQVAVDTVRLHVGDQRAGAGAPVSRASSARFAESAQ